MINCRVINEFEEFSQLEHQWNDMAEHSQIDHVYIKHRWFTEWIRAHSVEKRLAVVTLWSDGQLVAAAPLFRQSLSFRGLKTKSLRFISFDISPRCGFITVDIVHIPRLLGEVFSLDSWDVILTENMEEHCPATRVSLDLLEDRCEKGLTQTDRSYSSPYLTLKGPWNDFWETLPVKRRKYLERMCLKRLEKAGSFEVSKVTTPEQFSRFVSRMFEISLKSWKSIDESHLAPDSALGRMYLGFTPYGLDMNWVDLHVLSINENPVCFEYLLSYRDTHCLTRCDFDESYRYYSPGNSLRLFVLKDMISDGRTHEYDLCGDDYCYKLDWTKNVRTHITVTVGNTTTVGKLVMTAKNVALPYLRSCARLFRSETARK